MPELRHVDQVESLSAKPKQLEPVVLHWLWPDDQIHLAACLLYGVALLVLIAALTPVGFVLVQLTGLSIYLIALTLFLPLAVLLLLLIDRVELA